MQVLYFALDQVLKDSLEIKMADTTKMRFETLQLHAGQEPDPHTKSRAVPIYPTTSYTFDDSAQAARVFSLKEPRYIYSRIGNPTNTVFEQRVAALEGGIFALSTSSGQSAQLIAIACLAQSGDNIISTTNLYGGTYNQFKVFLKRMGITTKFVSGSDPAALAAAIDDKTKAVFLESISNPIFDIPDLQGIADAVHAKGVPLIVDNTFGAGGFFIRPIEHGADIVVHSATKWIGGHGTTIAGVVVDSGKFDWVANAQRFPEMNNPSPGYHGLKFLDTFGPMAFGLKLQAEVLRDVGCSLNPFGAHQLIIGLETLSIRCERHASNAMQLAEWLEKNEYVTWVNYPGLKSHRSHALAKKYCPRGYGGMLAFGAKGGATKGIKVVDSLKLHSYVANVGDCKSLAIHPWSTTHEQLAGEEKVNAGITEDLIRISVGIEHIDDIIGDFEQAFKVAFAE